MVSSNPQNVFVQAWEYGLDAVQRGVLFADVMRQRGDQYREHMREKVPHVLSFEFEGVMSGLDLPRPVNYGLVRIKPSADVPTDRRKRPFVVVDPRAGHGPGIGGFKPTSEIGAALGAGHPCYFIGFAPEPVKGQTIEDVMAAEAVFLERVIALHPEAEGKPAVVGNCQAGWAVMMLAAVRPELFGPIIVAGSPLSYWGGVKGGSAMRYSGGNLGGSWLTMMTGDLGNGIFDGAWLVQNFEGMNPANTYWSKQYNLYSKIDTEAERYLGFEQWWGGHVLLNAEEIQYIVDNLFVGNKLATAEIVTGSGDRIDLRNISSPVVVFCSKGDDITPPHQALGWILDLYDSVDAIRAHGQTIVYAVHDTIGHLGIFVSAKVATREHQEFASNIDLIDVLPPGLYEAVITTLPPGSPGAEHVVGDTLLQLQPRSLDDLKAIAGTDPQEEKAFAAAARLSDINKNLYEVMWRPWVKALATEPVAEVFRQKHPLRLQYEAFGGANPLAGWVEQWAGLVRAQRMPVARDNPFLAAETAMSSTVVATLEAWGRMRDAMSEQVFFAFYGSPIVQAMLGVSASPEVPARRHPGVEPEERRQMVAHQRSITERMGEGGIVEAAFRGILYVAIAIGPAADERFFNYLRRLRDERMGGGMSVQDFKRLVREQTELLWFDIDAAVAAIPTLAERNSEHIADAIAVVKGAVGSIGTLDREVKARLDRVEGLFLQALPKPVAEKPSPPATEEVARRAPTPRQPPRRIGRQPTRPT